MQKKAAKIFIIPVITACFIAVGIIDYHRDQGKRTVQNHRNDHHPVVNALFVQKIRPGQSVEKLLAEWPPTRYSQHNNFTTLYYVKGNEEPEACCGGYSSYIYVIAMDGKLAKALAVEGVLSEVEYVFFNILDTAQEDAYWVTRLQSVTAKE